MDDPDHTRNPMILEEGVLPTKYSVWVMGILEVGSDYATPLRRPLTAKKKRKNNSSSVKDVLRWQLAQQGAQGNHPSVPFVPYSEGQSSTALHVAAVLFTSPRKPITSPWCCASQSCYISHTHTHTHIDKHLQHQLFLDVVEGTDNSFWPVCGEIYRRAHMERLFTAQAHYEAS